MNRRAPTRLHHLLTVVALGLLALAPHPALAQEKPSLADEIRSVLENDGLEAAQKRFDELYPERRDEYEIDPRGFAEMGADAMQSGDMATGQAIMEMVQRITRDMVDEMERSAPVPSDEEREAERRRREAEREARRQRAQERRAAAVRERLGEPRDDLERFTGIYLDPASSQARGLFVAERCDGYLVVGATWGDAQNWNLRSLSETEFEATMFGGETVRFSLALGANGTPETLTHDLEFLDSPLPYHQSLAEFGWSDECVAPRGG